MLHIPAHINIRRQCFLTMQINANKPCRLQIKRSRSMHLLQTQWSKHSQQQWTDNIQLQQMSLLQSYPEQIPTVHVLPKLPLSLHFTFQHHQKLDSNSVWGIRSTFLLQIKTQEEWFHIYRKYQQPKVDNHIRLKSVMTIINNLSITPIHFYMLHKGTSFLLMKLHATVETVYGERT